MTVTIEFKDSIVCKKVKEEVALNVIDAIKIYDDSHGIAPKESGTSATSVNVYIKKL